MLSQWFIVDVRSILYCAHVIMDVHAASEMNRVDEFVYTWALVKQTHEGDQGTCIQSSSVQKESYRTSLLRAIKCTKRP
jgi:hypothetical protein